MTARNATAPEVTFDFNIDKLDIAELQQAIGSESSNRRNRRRRTARFRREGVY